MRWHEWPVVTGGARCTLGGAWRCVRVTSRTRHTVHVSVTHVMSPTHWPLSLSGCRLCNMVSGARWFAGCVVECLLCFPHLAPRHWLRCDNKVAMLRAPSLVFYHYCGHVFVTWNTNKQSSILSGQQYLVLSLEPFSYM